MTDEQWQELKPYAEARARAMTLWQAHQAMNQPIELKAAIEAQVAMHRAYLELCEATTAYNQQLLATLKGSITSS